MTSKGAYKPERGLSALRKCAKTVKEYNSEASGDYAAIQKAMDNTNLACGRLDKAKDYLQKSWKFMNKYGLMILN